MKERIRGNEDPEVHCENRGCFEIEGKIYEIETWRVHGKYEIDVTTEGSGVEIKADSFKEAKTIAFNIKELFRLAEI